MADHMSGGNAAAQNAIRELVNPLVEEARQTRAAITDRVDAQRRVNRWVMALIAVMALVLTANLVLLLQGRARSLQNGEILRNSAKTSDLIADCTQPGGQCYQESQKRTAGVVSQLLHSNLAIVQCARQTRDDAALEACVMAKLQAQAATPPATPAPSPQASGTP